MVVIVDERSHVAVLYLIYRSVKSSNAQFKVEGLFYSHYETRIGRHNLKDSQWLFFLPEIMPSCTSRTQCKAQEAFNQQR